MKINRLWVPLAVFLGFLVTGLLTGHLMPGPEKKVLTLFEQSLKYLLQVGIWFSAAYLLNRLLAAFFWDGIVASIMGGSTPRLIKDVVAFLIYLFALTGIVGLVFKQSITGIWATSGAIGLVIGFALRSIILDVFTGLAVNVERPYKIGDWIMVHGRRPELHIIGQLEEINWRTTRIGTKDGNILIIPNSIMGQSMITNFMMPEPKNRHEIFFVLDFSVPPEKALRILLAATKSACGKGPKSPLEDPPPKIRITRTTKSGVEYRVRYWIIPAHISPGKSRHLITQSILEHLQQAGLTLAYPKKDIFYDQMPNRQLDANSVEDRIKLLSRIELFATLTPDELQGLARNMEQHLFDEGTCLIKSKEEGSSMFILVEGLLDVLTDVKGDGTEQRVAKIIPGNFFGEMSLLTGEPRSATIQASTESIVYEITKQHVDQLIKQRPALLELLSQTIARRKTRDKNRNIQNSPLDTETETSNIASQLVNKMRSFFGGVFRISPSKTDLPAATGSSPSKTDLPAATGSSHSKTNLPAATGSSHSKTDLPAATGISPSSKTSLLDARPQNTSQNDLPAAADDTTNSSTRPPSPSTPNTLAVTSENTASPVPFKAPSPIESSDNQPILPSSPDITKAPAENTAAASSPKSSPTKTMRRKKGLLLNKRRPKNKGRNKKKT